MVGDNACELELPEAMKIHPVVNISQVKKYHGSLQRPPPIEIDGRKSMKSRISWTTGDLAEATSTWYLGQIMMPPRTSSYLSKSYNTVESC